MTLRHTLAIIRKDVAGGPRAMMVVWLIAMPLATDLLYLLQ